MRSRGRVEQEIADLGLREQPLGRGPSGETGGAPIRLTHHHVRKAMDPGIRALMPCAGSDRSIAGRSVSMAWQSNR